MSRENIPEISSKVLTGESDGPITRSNDGGVAAGEEILRPLVLFGPLKKGLAKLAGKVLKVDSFGETEGTLKPLEGNFGRPLPVRRRVL